MIQWPRRLTFRMPRQRTDPVARFWLKVDRSGNHWLWTAGRHQFGYGKHSAPHPVTGRITSVSAARFALELALGRPLAPGMHALHTCDVPGCVRNDEEGWYEVNGVLRPRRGHLFEGTHADNMADRDAKHRVVAVYGEAHGQSKLTAADVREIRRLAGTGLSRRRIAAQFGVSYSPIAAILEGRTWRGVE